MNDEHSLKSSATQPQGESGGSREAMKACCRDLEVITSELDAFLYAVSHDLGAPIRAIQGFSRILHEKYADKLDEKGKDYLLRVHEAGRRMDQMVNELLQISRLTTTPMKIEKVDLSGIARGIVNRLGASSPDRKVVFNLTENVCIPGDLALLTLALENLLENAWKFTQKTENAVIEFGVEQKGEECIYFVRDNGVGFAMANAANRLFKPFQKLHHALDDPGLGTGLAKVNRIVRKCGGTIWFESEEQKGTTFYFTLQQGDSYLASG